MAGNDIFAELNAVLAKPNLGRGSKNKGASPRLGEPRDRPSEANIKRLGFATAKLLFDAQQVGPLAPPTRSRDHRFRSELSTLFDPAIHGDDSAEGQR